MSISDAAAPPFAARPKAQSHAEFQIVPARHPWRHGGTATALVVIIAVVNSVASIPRWGWGVFAQWFFSEPVLAGLGRTLLLTALGAGIGFALGAGIGFALGAGIGFALGGVIALARVSTSPLLSGLAWTYIWSFRSIPLIVPLLILNNLGYLYETIWLVAISSG